MRGRAAEGPPGLQIPGKSGRTRGRAAVSGRGVRTGDGRAVGGRRQRLLSAPARPGFCSISDMAVPCVFLLTVLGAEVTSKSTDSLESDAECCVDTMEANSTCLANSQCTPGCYRRWNEDGSSTCVKCENETLPAAPAYNLTDCQNNAAGELNPLINLTTLTPETFGIGGPEVAASLIFGTFLISLFLILCVASFFYLKRANKLPNLFYRRSKGSIVQSAESASMLSPPSSIRKPRYVRRDRSLATSTTSTTLSTETRVSNV